ncbi:hypothetical protein [Kaarinaea lacus]
MSTKQENAKHILANRVVVYKPGCCSKPYTNHHQIPTRLDYLTFH